MKCCKSFEDRINLKGMRGLSIEKTGREMAPFKLVIRTTDEELESKFVEEIQNKKFSINHILGEEVRIKYCPWCGKKL